MVSLLFEKLYSCLESLIWNNEIYKKNREKQNIIRRKFKQKQWRTNWIRYRDEFARWNGLFIWSISFKWKVYEVTLIDK